MKSVRRPSKRSPRATPAPGWIRITVRVIIRVDVIVAIALLLGAPGAGGGITLSPPVPTAEAVWS